MIKHSVYLRALEPDDYLVSIKWRNDEEIRSLIGGASFFVSSETERRWVIENIENTQKYVFAICKSDDKKYIGNFIIHEIDWRNKSVVTGIMIGEKNEWNKGYAYEAMLLGLRYVFNEMNMNRVEVLILEKNLASMKLHEKCGFKIEGKLRKSIYKNGVYQNQYILGLLKEDFVCYLEM